ncbi:MAG: hypothetical protein HC945_00575 [Nitrosarchaeum sp.]|nr:hypothetical protein [Nitrosarchaeum sp.]
MQFTWIFALVAGITFLAFFIYLAGGMLDQNEDARDVAIIANLESKLKEMRSSKATSTQIKGFGKDITIICEQAQQRSELRIGSLSKDTRTLALYAPHNIKGQQLTLHTRPIQTPFLADTALYITDEQHRYHFLSEPTGIAQELHENLHNLTSTYGITAPQGNFPTRQILISTPRQRFLPTDITIPPRTGNGAVIITPQDQTDPEGISTVTYYEGTGTGFIPGPTLPVLGRAGMLAAIFSEDAETLACAQSKSLSRIATVAAIHLKQATAMQNDLQAQSNRCAGAYFDILSSLRAIENAAKTSDLQTLSTQAQTLKRAHNDLQLQDCPHVY